jgi:hypothetical protein
LWLLLLTLVRLMSHRCRLSNFLPFRLCLSVNRHHHLRRETTLNR